MKLLQIEEGDSDAKQPKRMINIIAAVEAKETKCFKKNETGVSNAAERPKEMRIEMMLLNFANKKLLKPFMRAISAEHWDQKLNVVGLAVNATRGSIIKNQYICSLTID